MCLCVCECISRCADTHTCVSGNVFLVHWFVRFSCALHVYVLLFFFIPHRIFYFHLRCCSDKNSILFISKYPAMVFLLVLQLHSHFSIESCHSCHTLVSWAAALFVPFAVRVCVSVWVSGKSWVIYSLSHFFHWANKIYICIAIYRAAMTEMLTKMLMLCRYYIVIWFKVKFS